MKRIAKSVKITYNSNTQKKIVLIFGYILPHYFISHPLHAHILTFIYSHSYNLTHLHTRDTNSHLQTHLFSHTRLHIHSHAHTDTHTTNSWDQTDHTAGHVSFSFSTLLWVFFNDLLLLHAGSCVAVLAERGSDTEQRLGAESTRGRVTPGRVRPMCHRVNWSLHERQPHPDVSLSLSPSFPSV